jgi:hypothetical protein
MLYETPPGAVIVTWVAFAAVTFKVDELPDVMVVGFAVIVTDGAGFSVTLTVVVTDSFPPGPEAVAV